MPHKATWVFFSSTGAEFTVFWRKQSVLWQILLHNVKIHKINICLVMVPYFRGETETQSNGFYVICYN